MGTFGGAAPFPRKFGGATRRQAYILAALLHSDSKDIGLDVTSPEQAATPSNVWIEDYVVARAIAQAWSTNARSANEFDPLRTQSMLERWEAVFGIQPASGDSLAQRRARVKFAWEALTKVATYQQIVDDLNAISSGVFVGITHTSSATGPSYYPGSPFANPYDLTGTTTAGVSLVDWWSNTMHLAVQVAAPYWMGLPALNDNVARINQYLDGALPAWCTWSVYQLAHGGALGFFLDEVNLDVEALRV